MNKKSKTIIRITVITLVALIIGINIYTMNATRLAGDTVPMPFGIGAAVVLSGSMEPNLSVGDLLIVVKRNDYAVEDIVVYQDGNIAVTHRIVSASEDEIITCGDANNTNDAPIHPNQIKGTVVTAIPLVGYAVNAIKTPIGTLCILGLAIFLLERSFSAEKQEDDKALDEIRSEIEKLKQNQNKKD